MTVELKYFPRPQIDVRACVGKCHELIPPEILQKWPRQVFWSCIASWKPHQSHSWPGAMAIMEMHLRSWRWIECVILFPWWSENIRNPRSSILTSGTLSDVWGFLSVSCNARFVPYTIFFGIVQLFLAARLSGDTQVEVDGRNSKQTYLQCHMAAPDLSHMNSINIGKYWMFSYKLFIPFIMPYSMPLDICISAILVIGILGLETCLSVSTGVGLLGWLPRCWTGLLLGLALVRYTMSQ